MKKLILAGFLVLLTSTLYCQSYRTALGVRFGTNIGLTVQQRLFNQTTIEGILERSLYRDQTVGTVLLEQHKKIIGKNVNLYFGGGLHTGVAARPEGETTRGLFGITGIVGLEITIKRFNISYDLKPAINLVGGAVPIDLQTDLSVRYVLWKKPKRENLFDKKKKKNDAPFWKKKEQKKKKKWWEING